MQVQPYVFFNGRCEEAMKFYGEKLGAEVVFQMRFKDAPPSAAESVPPGNEEKIMHTTFRIGATELMASDGDCKGEGPRPAGFSLSLTADDVPSAEKYFNALSDGGNVMMPWQATFWSKGFGMVVDRFGIPWMVTVPHEGG
ncbi:VOC family protein [Paraburkholderia sp. GAS334]|jgi:PhnB protein|uniref:VOC family protein n=1 Tax=Paraburkholderia sp. GAS334 TaxID=3035131 RepID=UPI003D23E214